MEKNGLLIPSLEGAYKERAYQQRLSRPFKVVQNLPIAKGDIDYSALKSPLSIKDSAVLYNSLFVSRYNWLHHVFRVYWSKREQAIVGDKDTQKKDKTVRFCDANFNVGVHKFAVKLFFLKDDLKEKQFAEEQERKREERLQRRKAKEEEKLKKKLEKERLEKEKEALKEKLRIEFDTQMKVMTNPTSNPTSNPISNSPTSLPSETQNQIPTGGNTPVNVAHTSANVQVNFDTAGSKEFSSTTEGTCVSATSQFKSNISESKVSDISPSVKESAKNSLSFNSINDSQTKTQDTSSISKKSSSEDISPKLLTPISNKLKEPTEENDQKFRAQPIAEDKMTKNTQTNENSSIKISTNESKSCLTNDTRSNVATNEESKSIQDEKAEELMSDPINGLLIQNLNFLARTDPHLNEVMKEVASGAAPAVKILEFKKYIERAKRLGDPTGYMRKLEIARKITEADFQRAAESHEQKIKAKERAREKAREKARQKKLEGSVIEDDKPLILTLEERKKIEEEHERQTELVKEQLEKMRLEKQRLREEREAEKLRLKQERAEKKLKEKEQREMEKQRQREEKAKEKERRKAERLAEKERQKIARDRKKDSIDYDDSDSEEENDRMAKLNSEEVSDDLWNDKLSPLQERYSKNATLVFEFVENPAQRFFLPRDTIYEVIEDEDDNNDKANSENVKMNEENSSTPTEFKAEVAGRPKSPYVTILASFVLVHNQAEIDGWDRRKLEAEEAEAKKIKTEQEETENKKRRRKKSGWSSSQVTKRATRASKQAKAIETLRREEENFHEEDEELNQKDDSRPKPVYSCITVTLSKVPYRFADLIVNSGNDLETCRTNMETVMSTGTRILPNKLWYHLDGIKDELLAETLRYNLNRLDYACSSGKRTKHQFLKKFGRGGG
ncbi:hypothetical protein CANINC_000266 [Pichia inconspicua]|uniref:Uncharacterized protein n=1 Tax=Pichia inconspicua TaxID=52247 RepID=A0A4T0X6N2_9ASCO|nr:hypothetical protein CANINC_000266 [[Candida] inconspicua]